LTPVAAGVSEWSKEQGLGPCRVGVRGFEPHPPHFRRDLTGLTGSILNTLFWMKKQVYPESTLKATSRRLRNLNRYCNLDDPEDVKACIAKKQVSNSYKRNLVRAYGYYAKVNAVRWIKPRYYPEKKSA
jgi:ABC-type ATPase with predicted acetyltransferase domain